MVGNENLWGQLSGTMVGNKNLSGRLSGTMLDELRDTCRRLSARGPCVVIGYGQADPADRPYPVFITRPEDADQLVWNDQCLANLTANCSRREVLALGKAAICVKGCDERALLVLRKNRRSTGRW